MAAGVVHLLAGQVSSTMGSRLCSQSVRALANAALDNGSACLDVMPFRLVQQLCEAAESHVRVCDGCASAWEDCLRHVNRISS